MAASRGVTNDVEGWDVVAVAAGWDDPVATTGCDVANDVVGWDVGVADWDNPVATTGCGVMVVAVGWDDNTGTAVDWTDIAAGGGA